MKDAILKLKTLLPASDFIITGSYVLSQYGLMPKEMVKDIDIILVKPEPTAVNNMVNFQKDFPAKTKPIKSDFFIFMFDDIKIDVFVDDNFKESTLLIDGIKHANISYIIKAKMTIGRMKDWLQCRDMARLIFKQEDFEHMLNNKWRQTLNANY
jgi:hypothetical protein